jgi:hypothetical protein
VPWLSARRIAVPVLVAALAAFALVLAGPDWLYGPVAAFTMYMDEGPGLLPALVYLAIAAIPVTLLHEFGHAIVALRLLGTPVGVVVGSFGKLAQVRLGQITMSLNAVGSPASVAGSTTFDASRAEARDILCIAVAGPAASLLGLLASIALLAAAPEQGVAHDLVWAAILGNLFAVLNLIPLELQERADGPRLHTDGRLALDAARTLRALR